MDTFDRNVFTLKQQFELGVIDKSFFVNTYRTYLPKFKKFFEKRSRKIQDPDFRLNLMRMINEDWENKDVYLGLMRLFHPNETYKRWATKYGASYFEKFHFHCRQY